MQKLTRKKAIVNLYQTAWLTIAFNIQIMLGKIYNRLPMS